MYHVKILDTSAEDFSDEVINELHFKTKEEAENYADEVERMTQFEAIVGVDVDFSLPSSRADRLGFILGNMRKEIAETYFN